MLIIPDEVKALFQNDGVHKNFHVHFPNGDTTDLNNENIVQESVRFTESLCSQQYFKFGLAEASQIEFTAVNIPNILGSTIECAIEIDCTNLGAAWATAHPVDPTLDFLEPQTCTVNSKMYYRVPYGIFVVDSCPRDHSVMAQRKIVAYSPEQFDETQALIGQYPIESYIMNPFEWVITRNIDTSDMTEVTYNYSNSWIVQHMYTSNGSKWISTIFGAKRATRSSQSYISYISFTRTSQSTPRGRYVFIFDYKKHDFDEYGRSFLNAVINTMPSESYVYGQADSNAYVQEFGSNAEALALNTGNFAPCFYIGVTYWNQNTYEFERLSKPVFVEPGIPYIVDLLNFENVSFFRDAPSGYAEMSEVKFYFSIPASWQKTGRLTGSDVDAVISAWESIAPFGDLSEVSRDGNIKLYYKQLNEPDLLKLRIQNTFKFDKGNGFGTYYTYSNAISTLNLFVGIMEILGKFWKPKRTGNFEEFNIADDQTLTPVSRTCWSEFWWDENEVSPIGVVSVKFEDSDTGDSAVTQFTIGSGASIYSMEDNEMLKCAISSTQNIQNALNTYFAPNASVINFTPVELKMKGLPYLETGDKIELTADDASTVETYILEQTISGIQHLVADVISTNGDLLEVTENE